MHWYDSKSRYTPDEVRRIVRTALTRMLFWALVGAIYSWSYAQLAVMYGVKRPLVGYIAVTVCMIVPVMGSIAHYGIWWFKPRPLRRFFWQVVRFLTFLGKTLMVLFAFLWRTLMALFALMGRLLYAMRPMRGLKG